MNEFERKAIRATPLIRERLTQVSTQPPSIESAELAWQICSRLALQMAKAGKHGWHLAAKRLRDQLKCSIGNCHRRVEEVERQLDAASRRVIQNQHDMLRDLLALETEFDQVDIDSKRAKLSVTTEPILLEGIDLGRFEIALDWRSISEPSAYEVISLDPSPAASDADTTHPHVQGSQLCEGEGRVPISQALGQGRLLDFFVLVRQILRTYNPGSAYVSLERWNGIDCHDCGCLMDEDDRSQCERCGTDVCYECSVGCAKCGGRSCSECAATCPACEDSFCSSCLQTCAGCNVAFCEECLTDDKCQACCESEKETETAKDGTIDPASETRVQGTAAVHTVCLGQAAIPA